MEQDEDIKFSIKTLTIDVKADPVILSFSNVTINEGDTLYAESIVYGKPRPLSNIVFNERSFKVYNFTQISSYTYKYVYNLGVLTADKCESSMQLIVKGNGKQVVQNATVHFLFTGAPFKVFVSKTDLKEGDSITISTQASCLFVMKSYYIFMYGLVNSWIAFLPSSKIIKIEDVFQNRISHHFQFNVYVLNFTNLLPNDSMTVFVMLQLLNQSGSTIKVNQSLTIDVKGCCKEDIFGETKYKGVYAFKKTCFNQFITKKCAYNSNGVVIRKCNGSKYQPVWEDPDLSQCESLTTKTLEYISKETICVNNLTVNCLLINDVSKNLSDTVANGSVITSYKDINFIAKTLKTFSRNYAIATDASVQVFEDILHTLNNVLDSNETYIAESQIKKASSTSIMNTLSQFASFYSDPYNDFISISKANIGFCIEKVNKGNITISAQKFQNSSVRVTFNNFNGLNKDTYAVIKLPIEVFTNGSEVIHSYFFLKHYFLLDEHSLSKLVKRKKYNKTFIQSAVLSASIGNRHVSNLKKPVILTFKKIYYLDVNGSWYNNSCGYWNESTETKTGNWLSTGCYKYESGNVKDEYFTCACDHLTNFALLLNLNQHKITHGVNELVLSITTYIGCGISLVGLLLTLVTLASFRKLRQKLPQKVLACLCISLMGLLITFLIGAKKTKPEIMCKVFAAVIHYFMLSTFCWMFLEGVNLYRCFVVVFKNKADDNFFRNANIFAWGVPAVVVTITSILKPNELGDNNLCIVHGYSFGFAVLFPVCIILLVNFVVLFATMFSLSNRINTAVQDTTKQYYLSKIRILFACSTILGLSWMFAVLAIGDLSPVFQWLFCIFTSLQGFFIFVFNILRNKDAIAEWKFFIRRHRSRGTSSSSNGNENNLIFTNLSNI